MADSRNSSSSYSVISDKFTKDKFCGNSRDFKSLKECVYRQLVNK